MQHRSRRDGFTLIELVLVMFIIALLSGILAPALIRFTTGRAVENVGRQIVAMARRARSQSISEARDYRLCFDQASGQLWLSADAGGGNWQNVDARYTVPDGVKIQLSQTNTGAAPAPVVQMPWAPSITPQQFSQPVQLLDGTTVGAGTIWVFPPTQKVIEFRPSGRTDPAAFVVTDSSGHSTQVACNSPTDRFAIQEGSR
jgi:prepilin-type N-terminal cleavage/methylation domain-containing protein